MEKLGTSTDRITKGKQTTYPLYCVPEFNYKTRPNFHLCFIDGLRISNSQVKRLERELKNLKEEVS